MRPHKLSYAWLTMLVGLTVVGLSASGPPDAPGQGAAAERFTSLGDAPDAATLGTTQAFATLLRILRGSPTATDPLVFSRGGTVFTPTDLDYEVRRAKPQIRIDRNLETARDGLWMGIPNELQLSASAPNGQNANFCGVSLTLRFTQLSPLKIGGLTPNGALAALRNGPANSITVSEVFLHRDGIFNSGVISGFESYSSAGFYRDFARGQYMVPVAGGEPLVASAKDVSKVLSDLAASVDCIVEAFGRQSDSSMPSDVLVSKLCSACVVTGSVVFPNRDDLRLITTLGIDVMNRAASVAVVDRGGQVLWQYSTAEWSELEPISEVSDDTGNVFVRYNPGRYDGVVIVGVRGDEILTFDSFPEYGSYFGRFYNSNVVDVDHDRVLDVVVHEGFCEKSCPNDTVFHWNGSSYVDG